MVLYAGGQGLNLVLRRRRCISAKMVTEAAAFCYGAWWHAWLSHQLMRLKDQGPLFEEVCGMLEPCKHPWNHASSLSNQR